MMKKSIILQQDSIEIFKTKDGKHELVVNFSQDTLWLTQDQIAILFGVQRPAISKHIGNIFRSEELQKESVCSILERTASDGKIYKNKFYNLDIIISVGYRVNSKDATHFRIWATDILKSHIIDGFTINKSRIQTNYEVFLQAVEDVQKLLPETSNSPIKTEDILELIKSFASTWLSLDSYDKDILPTEGFTQTNLVLQASELYQDVACFKKELISKNQATKLFAQEKNNKSLEGIFGNIFQSFDGQDLYPSLEEKAAHFLYFIVKNHPFTDGNKRTGAFCFLWFLSRVGFRFQNTITPEALTAITLLVAESNPHDKNRIVGLVILLLKK